MIEEDFQIRTGPEANEVSEQALGINKSIDACLKTFERIYRDGKSGKLWPISEAMHYADRLEKLLDQRAGSPMEGDSEKIFRINHIVRNLKNLNEHKSIDSQTLELIGSLSQNSNS